MKNLLVSRWSKGFLSVLVVAVLIISQASPEAWNSFVLSSHQMTRSIAGLFQSSQMIHVVSAQDIQNDLQNWQSWPKSQKHKGFDGGWMLPFEAFSQQYYRGWQNRNKPAQYFDKPLHIDLNGDGLQDLLFSKGHVSLHGQTQNFIWTGLEQYIILRRANGFELAYKCRQERDAQNKYWYYGDCADQNYTSGTDAAYEVVWTPGAIWYQQTPQMTNSHQFSDQDRQEYMGTNDQVFNYLNVDLNINGQFVETFDHAMPEFTDLNGDGLVDVVFFGQVSIGEQYGNGGPYTYVGTNYVLYNNGHGFDVEVGCIQKFYNWYPLNYSIPAGAVTAINEKYCF